MYYRRKMRLKMDALSRANEVKKRDAKEDEAIEVLQKELNIRTSQLNRALTQVKIKKLNTIKSF